MHRGARVTMIDSFKEVVWKKDSYGLLLILLLVDYLILSMVNSIRWGGLIRTVPVALTVLVALHTSGARRMIVTATQVVMLASFVFGVVQSITGSTSTGAICRLMVAVLLMISPVAILRRILEHRRVTMETIFAAVDVYIIIGLIFALLFVGLAGLFGPPGFPRFLAQTGSHPPASDYVYLSFVTLTTVGFGDITPYSNLARSVVVLEALVGQIFLVTLVARLVSMYNSENERPLRRRNQGDDS